MIDSVVFFRFVNSVLAFATIPFAFSLAGFLYRERAILKGENPKNLNKLLTLITVLFIIVAFYSGALSLILALHVNLGNSLGTDNATNVFNIRNILVSTSIFAFCFGMWRFIKEQQ